MISKSKNFEFMRVNDAADCGTLGHLPFGKKVLDQQNTLEKAGVSGFYITTNPQVNLFITNKNMF